MTATTHSQTLTSFMLSRDHHTTRQWFNLQWKIELQITVTLNHITKTACGRVTQARYSVNKCRVDIHAFYISNAFFQLRLSVV